MQEAVLNLVGGERYVVAGQCLSRLAHLRHVAVADLCMPKTSSGPIGLDFCTSDLRAPNPKVEGVREPCGYPSEYLGAPPLN